MANTLKKRNTVLIVMALAVAIVWRVDGASRDVDISKLIDQLVFNYPGNSGKAPLLSPGAGGYANDPEYKRQVEKCLLAYRTLTELGEEALPLLVEHIDDKRPSINFRNHYLEHAVGNACFWIVYSQLTDWPEDYSSYGLTRLGRDGKRHTKPEWEGSPFEEAGSLKEWLEKNSGLSYRAKQIKCLNWFLEREKKIGACDAASYFENIMPLEIRILERKQQIGENVEKDLARLRKIRENRLVNEIPRELLPDKKQD